MDSYLPAWITAIYTSIGMFSMALGIPLLFGVVPPNPWYGWRTSLTLTVQSAWKKSNQRFGWVLFLGGLGIQGASLHGFFRSAGVPEFPIATWNLGATLIVWASGLWIMKRA